VNHSAFDSPRFLAPLMKTQGFGMTPQPTISTEPLKDTSRQAKEFPGRPIPKLGAYSYLSASAGRVLPADHEGYSVATKETPIATSATSAPSINLGANGT
jgi:hypothetical protein